MDAEPTRRGEQDADIPTRLAQEMDRDDLSRLVREANDDGLSYQDMADNAQAAGHDISKPYFQKLATNQVSRTPNVERLGAIAAGIRRPLAIVKRAAARQYMQYENTGLSGYDDEVQVIVAHLAGMPAEEVRRWRAMIEADRRARGQAD